MFGLTMAMLTLAGTTLTTCIWYFHREREEDVNELAFRQLYYGVFWSIIIYVISLFMGEPYTIIPILLAGIMLPLFVIWMAHIDSILLEGDPSIEF
jgi:hypothetical protein